MVPGNMLSRGLTIVASANGLLLFTMSITYAIPIISAATEKRQLALTINALGESPFDICRTTVGNGDFAALASQLEQIPGIGPVKALAIVNYIKSNESFNTLADIQKVHGIGPATWQKIEWFIVVQP